MSASELDSIAEIQPITNEYQKLLDEQDLIHSLDDHDLTKLVNDCHASMMDKNMHGPFNDQTQAELKDLASILHIAAQEYTNRCGL